MIERHVLSLPMSRVSALLPALGRSLAIYRMVNGRARQEDLVEYLKRTAPEDAWERLARELALKPEPAVAGDHSVLV